MLKTLEKSWPIISIFFTFAILASLFFWPGTTRLLSLLVMGLGLLAIVTFTVRQHVQAHRQGKITRPVLARNIVVDLLGVSITMILVILIAGRTGTYAGQMAGKAWGVTAGILSGLLAGLVTGFGVGLFVRWIWGKLTKPTLRRERSGQERAGSAPAT